MQSVHWGGEQDGQECPEPPNPMLQAEAFVESEWYSIMRAGILERQ